MEVKRGQVWYVGFGDGVGAEQTVGRPAVIVSSEYGCETNMVVSVVFLTSSPNKTRNTVHPTITSTSRKGVALCEQVTCVDKSRLKNYICDVYPEELEDIESGLRLALGLESTTGVFEDREQEYKAKIESLEDAWCSWKTEADTYKRLYEKALEKLADAREQPLPVKTLPEVKVLPKAKVVLDTPTEEGPKQLIDINRCGEDDLIALNLAPYVVAEIISRRPYMRTEDLKKVPSVTSIMYQLIQHAITVGDTVEFRKPKEKHETDASSQSSPEGKLNINTAKWTDYPKFKINTTYATKINKARRELGRFESIEDLLTVGAVGKIWFERHRDSLTVGDEEELSEPVEVEVEVVEETSSDKLNINTATIRELMKVGFGKSAAAKIYNHRKRNGEYRNVDALLSIDGVTSKVLRKVRDELEV